MLSETYWYTVYQSFITVCDRTARNSASHGQPYLKYSAGKCQHEQCLATQFKTEKDVA